MGLVVLVFLVFHLLVQAHSGVHLLVVLVVLM
jgi:hypothetical protein